MLLRHKLTLKGAKDLLCIEFLKQYLGMFKEVATLVFDIAVYLGNITTVEADDLVNGLH